MKILTLIACCVAALTGMAQERPAAGVYFPQQRAIVLVDVDCEAGMKMLEEIYDSDQLNRKSGRQIDEEIDYQNQVKVVSYVEKCGWPARSVVGTKGMQAIFLVIQHASAELRQKYFPLIKESAAKGDISPRVVAMMEDRMLMEQGKKQKYGTQLISYGDGPLKLHPVEDPGRLNERRAARFHYGCMQAYYELTRESFCNRHPSNVID